VTIASTRWVQIALLASLCGGCAFRVAQESLLFPQEKPTPPEAETSTRKNVEIPLGDGTVVRGWFQTQPGARRTFLFFYGNAQTVVKTAKAQAWLAKQPGSNVLAVDYRGYGFSDGRPALDVIAADGPRIYDYLTTKLIPRDQEVILVGYSLGNIVAIHTIARRPVSRAILLAPPTDVVEVMDLARKRLPWYYRMWVRRIDVAPELADMRPRPIDDMPQVKVPLLVVHGTEDDIVPYPCGQKIFELAGTASGEKRLCTIPGGTHVLRLSEPAVEKCVLEFLDQARSP
jgi:uncharacterized protein